MRRFLEFFNRLLWRGKKYAKMKMNSSGFAEFSGDGDRIWGTLNGISSYVRSGSDYFATS